MKPRILSAARISFPLAAALAAMLASQTARAASATWNGTTGLLWSTSTNWSGSPVTVPGVGDTATFSNAGNGNVGITVGTISLSQVLFDTASAAAYTLGSGTITFANATTTAVNMTGSVTANEIINANLTLGTAIASTTTFNNDSTSGLLTLGGNITGGSGGTAAAKTVTFSGAGNITVGGIIAPGGASGLSLTKSGAGTLTLNGSAASTYVGATTISGGKLVLDFANMATPTNLLAATSAPTMGAGTLFIKGKTGAFSTAQILGAVTGTTGTTSKIFIDPNGGTGTTLTLGTLTGFTTNTNSGRVLVIGKAPGAGSGTVTVSAGTAGSLGRVLYTPDGGTTMDFWGAASGAAVSYTALTATNTNSTGSTYFRVQGSLARTTTPAAGNVDQIAGGIKLEATGASQNLDVFNGLTTAGLLATGSNAYEIKATGTGQYAGLVIPNNSALTISQYNTGGLTISAPIENTGTTSGVLVKSGSEKLTLSGTNTYKGITYINEGTLSVSTLANGGISAGNLSYTAGSNSVTVATGTGSLAVGMSVSADDIPIGATISSITDSTHVVMSKNAAVTGSGVAANWGTANNLGLAANAAANLSFGGGTLQYTGGTVSTDRGFTIVAGTTGTFEVTASGTNLTLTGASASTTGNLAKTGAGTLTLSGANAYTGNTTISTGTLQIGAAGQLGAGTYAGNITNSGVFNYSSSAAQTLSGVISGSGPLTKDTSSASTLALSGTNTYTGVTTITAGVLRLNAASALPGGIAATGGTSALTFNGGVLGLGNGDFTRSLGAAGTTTAVNFTGNGGWAAYTADRLVNLGGASTPITWATADTGFNGMTLILSASTADKMVTLQNPIDLGTAARTVQVDDGSAGTDATLSGVLSGGTGGSLTKTGTGTLALSSTNTYSGGTLISAGTLTLGAQLANPLGSGTITVNSGATFSPNGSTFTNALILNGGTVMNGNSFAAVFSGPVTLNATSTLDLSTTGNMTISGNVSGAGGLTKIGTSGAPVVINGTNSYTGITTVSAGVLEFKSSLSLYNNDPLQWIPSTIIVASGATLMVNVGGGSDFTASQAGTLFGNLTTVNNNGLKAGSFMGFDTANGAANIGANLTDSTGAGGGAVGLLKLNGNTLTLSGANSYSGKTYNRGGGTLSVASFNSVATNSGLGTVHSASSSLGAPTTVANGTIDLGDSSTSAGVKLIYTGSGEITDRVLNFAAQGTNNHTIDQSGSGLLKFTSPFAINSNTGQGLTLTGSTTGTGELAGSLPMVTGTLTKTGTGT